MPGDHRRQRFVAYGTGGFALAVNAMIQFLVPLRAVELGIGVGMVGLLLAAKALTEALVAVPLGRFLDIAGVRTAFLVGTAASAVTAFAYTAASSFLALLLLQVALGVGRPLAWLGAQHYVSGMRTGADQAYDTGRMSFVANIGQIVGPFAVGLAAATVGLRDAFAVLAVYCAAFFLLGLALPAAQRRGPSASAKPSGGKGLRPMLALLAVPALQVAMLLTSARLWITTVWMSFYPLYLVQQVELSEAVAGTVVSAMALTATVISFYTGRLSALGRAQLLTMASLALGAVGLALGPVLAVSGLVYVSAVLVGVGHGLSLPLLIVIVSNGAPEGRRGAALGLRTTVNQGASALAPATVAPIIASAGAVVAFPVAGAIGAAVLLWAALRDRPWSPASVAGGGTPG